MTELDLKSLKFWPLVIAFSFVKLLFYKAYRSTDFDVHRNWLAITHSLPHEKWYYEDTSQWTLDYPPFFAYFEFLLSQIAYYFDPEMLKVTNLGYSSENTILFQRLSVIVADFVLAYGVYDCAESLRVVLPGNIVGGSFGVHKSRLKIFGLIFVNGGLFLVDHIHFQYNGFLFGILLLSISKIVQGKIFQGAFLFATLLNLKHIFLYIAPAFGIYLFRRFCTNIESPSRFLSINFGNLIGLGVVVLSIFAASFGPFYQHIPQILKRLFPFKRGLSHAFWAPNIWAIYNTAELVLNYVSNKAKSGITSGLVEDHDLTTLFKVEPIHTFSITLVFMLPALWKIWNKPTELNFIRGIIITAWTSFMFGYHVHEKAILNVVIPFSLVSFFNPKLFILTLIPGTVSLFPLLFTPFEIVSKLLFALFHIILSYQIFSASSTTSNFYFYWYEKLYIVGFIPLCFLENLGSIILPFFQKYPFLPLVCISDYCFIGLFYCYLKYYWNFITFLSIKEERKISITNFKRKNN